MKLDASVTIRDRIEDLYRSDARRVFASLARFLKDFDLADDAMHEAYAAVPPLVTRAPVDGHYALAEKVLVDLLKESEDLKLMDSAQFEKTLRNAISCYRTSISAILAYAERRNAVLFSWAESINAN